MEFFNDRRPDPRKDGYVGEPLTRENLRAANQSLRSAAPVYRANETNRKIRTTAVQRHRTRKAGREDFQTVGEYMDFVLGANSGGD